MLKEETGLTVAELHDFLLSHEAQMRVMAYFSKLVDLFRIQRPYNIIILHPLFNTCP